MKQVIVDFGWVRLYGYGLMLVLGFLSGIALARWRARRFGEDPEVVTTLGLLALAAGVGGARLAYVVEQWKVFSRSPNLLWDIVNITSGGLIYFGGAFAALAVVALYLALKRLPVRRYLDIIAPSLMVGLAFGRAGCLLNGCCYGAPVDPHYPLAMRFPYASTPLVRLSDKGNVFGAAGVSPAFADQFDKGQIDPRTLPEGLLRAGASRPTLRNPSELTARQAQAARHVHSLPLQPSQVLSLVSALLLAGLLLAFSRLRRREGQVAAAMLVLYPITRILLEGLRGDNPHDLLSLRLTHNQWTAFGMLIFGVFFWAVLRWLPPAAGPSWIDRAAALEAANPLRQQKGRT